MKSGFFALALSVCATVSLTAQPGPRDGMQRDRIESLKIAFFTRELDLSPEESQKFWPVYNEWQEKQDALKEDMHPGKPLRDLSDKEMDALFQKRLAQIEQEAALHRDYLLKLRQVLPLRKLIHLPAAERDFKRRLMEEVHNRRDRDRRPRR